MKVLVLYSEIAGYFIAGVRQFVALYEAEVHVVRWPIHPEAPFVFEDEPGITYHERKALGTADLIALGEQVDPDVLYVAGWIDKPYLKVARHFRKKGKPVIAAFDTQWKGDFRQQVAVFLRPWLVGRNFSHAWVPGLYQYEYARRLGFPRARISTGMYTADSPPFEAVYPLARARKEKDFPRKLIYVGRYLALKGVLELYQAFRELCQEQPNDWTLELIGGGPLRDALEETPQIKLRDFVQPRELPELAMDAGIFVLPSRRDAWAVVLHEFAAAGMPLISTDAAGATTAFVKEDYNGWQFAAGDKDSLKAVLRKAIATPSENLVQMGDRSHELSRQISPTTWATTLYTIATQS